MAENFSFDVVSDFDRQELVNALDQVKREISQRYDLKGTDTSLDLEKDNIFITTNSELTLNSVIDIIRQKAIKRKLSIKIFDFNSIEVVSGNKVKQTITLKKGLNQEIAKKISKNIRDEIKKINVSINGESLRVMSKSKNDLQLAIKLLENLEETYKIPLQTNNYR
ncbi:YajQ family cyclic di-GMP-binding protein [Prochlorococcus sp. AH-716-G10]|nr:YajQ family cyclic di-GMP-binding protein [Prochlorococcus sp. AH-716-G10]